MKKFVFALLSSVCLFISGGNTGFACDFCLLSQGISPLDTMKSSGIKVSERYTLLDQVYQGTSKQANPGAKEEHWTTELTGFYSITPDFMLMAVVPYKKAKTNGDPDLTQTPAALDTMSAGDSSGLGDTALMGRYTLMKKEGPESTDVLAGLAGVKFATGKTDARTANGADFLDSHLQNGTGSTDYLLGLSYSHSLARFSVSANILGTITTKGKFGGTSHEFGNSMNYDVTGKFRVYPGAFTPTAPQVFIALGINGEAREREKMNGDSVPDSGGNTMYLAPGVQVVLAPHWAIDLSYLQAVYHNLNGTQLGETYKAIGGVIYLF